MKRRSGSNFIIQQESIFRRTTADDLVAMLINVSIVSILAVLLSCLASEWLVDLTLRATPLDYQQLAPLLLRTAYGLLFVLGGIIPSMLAFFVRTCRKELVDREVGSLRRGFYLYAGGGLAAAALLLYKGISYVVFFGSDPVFPMEGFNDRLFWGNPFLGGLLFGLADLCLAAGLIWCLMIILRANRR
ncbi:MAG: hypothetical protein KKC80_02380 [Candidatus Margulisbacteria bacterium]|nr:hypothetical protein [Candidatus Margulisiibacteriota bacterium]MBU1867324.1 hypothetical protein [Candidatus Margulisiibacteriota bacterium]